MRKLICVIATTAMTCLYAQSGELKGIVTETDGKTPIPFANVMVEQSGKIIAGQSADIEGNFWIKNITPGRYSVKFTSAGLPSTMFENVAIDSGKITFLFPKLKSVVTLSEYTVSTSKIKIDPLNTTEGGTFMRREISSVPSTSTMGVVSTTSGIYSRDGDATRFSGSRSDATVFVDGVKIRSGSSTVITGDVPAKFSDDVKSTDVIISTDSHTDDEHPVKLGNQLTAGEISDFTKYNQWIKLLDGEFKPMQELFMINTGERFLVMVSNHENMPVPFASVKLWNENDLVWQTVTDNTGKAELWTGLAGEFHSTPNYKISIEYQNNQTEIQKPRSYQKGINFAELNVPCKADKQGLEIAFVVDATGSMDDEINYLKDDLMDILQNSTKEIKGDISYASVFYRDIGDSYVTRKSNFTKTLQDALGFIKNQHSGEGGDFPEAVDKGLEEAVNLDWTSKENTKIIFMLLDAPPHLEPENLSSIRNSILVAANKGIRIVPIICSGADKDLEYLMRCVALLTNGTYVFLTDDSGIGGTHLKPSTDKYDVYTLNQLMTSIIKRFTYLPQCEVINDSIPVTERMMSYLNRPEYESETNDSITERDTLNMEVIPNPFPSETDIIINRSISGNISIFDMNGKLLITERFNNDSRYHLNMEQFANGTYFAIIESKSQRVVKKILKH